MALHVAGLWRYPVKSLAGERLTSAVIETGGGRQTRGVNWGAAPRSGSLGHSAPQRGKEPNDDWSPPARVTYGSHQDMDSPT